MTRAVRAVVGVSFVAKEIPAKYRVAPTTIQTQAAYPVGRLVEVIECQVDEAGAGMLGERVHRVG